MAYADIVVQQTISITSDCSEATVVDSTGEYPAQEGGFSASAGTSDRPDLTQVIFWYMWRRMDSEGVWQETIPESQTGDPTLTLSLLQESGDRWPDAAWQMIEMVVPTGSDWNDFDALPWDQIISGVLAIGTLGQAPMFPNCTSVNCTNDAMVRLNNAWMLGSCKTEEYALKKSLLQGSTDSINLAATPTLENVDAPTTTVQYQKTQEIIDALLKVCLDLNCRCNC